MLKIERKLLLVASWIAYSKPRSNYGDFFPLGWAKEPVYVSKPSSLSELDQCIRPILSNVPVDKSKASVANVRLLLGRYVVSSWDTS